MSERTINQIVIHHSGGLGNNNYASTAHLKLAHINRAHKMRWHFKSEYIELFGEASYTGYTIVYDPKTREFTLTRALGEETAAVKGHNQSGVHICIIGNYNKNRGGLSGTVDPMTKYIEDDVVLFINDLINGNKRKLLTARGATLDLSASRIYSHKFFSNNMCPGTGIENNHFRDLVLKYKPVSVIAPLESEDIYITELKKKISFYTVMLQAYTMVLDFLLKAKAQEKSLGAVDDREDPDNLPEGIIKYNL